MKKVIITLLKKGFTRSKKGIGELKRVLHFIDRIAEYDEKTQTIRCNGNKFWDCENNDNRFQLAYDVSLMTKSMLKGRRFDILNEYENGKAYGIGK